MFICTRCVECTDLQIIFMYINVECVSMCMTGQGAYEFTDVQGVLKCTDSQDVFKRTRTQGVLKCIDTVYRWTMCV